MATVTGSRRARLVVAAVVGAITSLLVATGAYALTVGPLTIVDPVGSATAAVTDSPTTLGCLAAAAGGLAQGRTVVIGTAGDDDLSGALTPGPDLVCGFDGNDTIALLGPDDVFLGGPGDDTVVANHGRFEGGTGSDLVGARGDRLAGRLDSGIANGNFGVFVGGDGNDAVTLNGTVLDELLHHRGVDFDAIFDAGPGDDFVLVNVGVVDGGLDNDVVTTHLAGIVLGGDGDDVVANNAGVFDAGPGQDVVSVINEGEYYGGPGNDLLDGDNLGFFDGGPGIDRITGFPGGFSSVEQFG